MSYAFHGILSDATLAEWSVLAGAPPARQVADPAPLVIAGLAADFAAVDALARRLSAKLLGRTVVPMAYVTWAGVLDGFSATVYRHGALADGLQYRDAEGDAGEEAFFRVLLELGVVLPDGGYFRPFDRSLPEHAGG
jgi:hypothetical protein